MKTYGGTIEVTSDSAEDELLNQHFAAGTELPAGALRDLGYAGAVRVIGRHVRREGPDAIVSYTLESAKT